MFSGTTVIFTTSSWTIGGSPLYLISNMELTSKTPFPSHRVRPRFKGSCNDSVDVIVSKIKAALEKENAPCFGNVHPSSTTLYIPLVDQHYWSPQLSLSFEEEGSQTIVRGLYGPRPVVWTMFVFFYTIIGLAILFISVMGYSYVSLGKSGAILWFLPVLLILFLSLYLVAHFGQKLGEKQMVILHHFLEQCLEINFQ